MSLGRTASALSAFYRRLAVRIGKAKAITATAGRQGTSRGLVCEFSPAIGLRPDRERQLQ